MTAFSLRLTNGANAVSQLHAETANATWQGIIDHEILGITNGVHGPTWVGAPIAELLERYLGADLDDLDVEHRAGPLLGAPRAHPGARPVGGAPAPEARARALRAAAGCAASSPATARRRRSWPSSRRALDPDDPDDRLRPPVRDLQAGRAAVQRHRPAGPDAVGRRAPGPDRLRRQGPPGRPPRPAGHPGDLPALALAAAARPGLHPRGLRHARRALPRPGRRRLAQQPAPAARGVRDVRA